MNWLNRLERKFGKYAITNLPLYIVMLYAVGAVLNLISNGNHKGQLWTCTIRPPTELRFALTFSMWNSANLCNL